MMRVLRTLALLICATGLMVPGGRAEGAAAPLAESTAAFAFDLYRAVGQREGNLFFSPYSISVALAMTRAGAAGDTASQMDAVLRLPPEGATGDHRGFAKQLEPPLVPESPQEDARRIPAYELSVANALWGHEELAFRERFLQGQVREARRSIYRYLHLRRVHVARLKQGPHIRSPRHVGIRQLRRKLLRLPTSDKRWLSGAASHQQPRKNRKYYFFHDAFSSPGYASFSLCIIDSAKY